MPRACSISAVTSPPIPPPTMMAFMQSTLLPQAGAMFACWGWRDQSPSSHTVSALYGTPVTAVNAATGRAGTRMTQPLTLFDKIWAQHEILEADNGLSLLWVDRHYVHEGSFQGFDKVDARGESVARP